MHSLIKRASKKASSVATPKIGASVVVKKSKRGVVRRAASGALLAAALAVAQTDDEETTSKWRLFDPNLLDRLSMPLTRYHE